MRCHVIVLDDIGTKVKLEKLAGVKPSYVIETSPGNFQWGFIFETPVDNFARVNRLVKAIITADLTDVGASGYNRLVRMPGSVNTKVSKNYFVSRVTEWNPDVLFDGVDGYC